MNATGALVRWSAIEYWLDIAAMDKHHSRFVALVSKLAVAGGMSRRD